MLGTPRVGHLRVAMVHITHTFQLLPGMQLWVHQRCMTILDQLMEVTLRSVIDFFVRSEHTETFLSLVFHCLTSINQEDTMDPLKQWARRYLLVDFHKKQTQMT